MVISFCDWLARDGSKVTTVLATRGQPPDQPEEVAYTDVKIIGNGSFGVVYQAKLCKTTEVIAIKKVLQDKRFKVGSPFSSPLSSSLPLPPSLSTDLYLSHPL